MRSALTLRTGAFLLVLLSASRLLAAGADRVAWEGLPARQAAMLSNALARPFPPVEDGRKNPLGNLAWALAALHLDTERERADELIRLVGEVFPNPTKDVPGKDFAGYFGLPMQVRLASLFGAKSPYAPGRLAPAGEEALKVLLWDFIVERSRLEDAALPAENTLVIDGSGNHDIIRKSGYLLAAEFLAEDERFRDRPLADGGTTARHAAAWGAYFEKAYFPVFGRKGFLVEFASPAYTKYTTECLLNLRDFARSARLREAAQKALDVFLADAIVDTLDGVRGGAKVRCYRTRDTFHPLFDSHNVIHQLLFGRTGPIDFTAVQHPSYLAWATTTYAPPPVYADLALRNGKSGLSTTVSFPAGEGENAPRGVPIYTLRFPSAVRRVSVLTSSWISGAFTVDPARSYVKLNTQNRWMGVLFSGETHPGSDGKPLDSRIFFSALGKSHGGQSGYDDVNGVARGSVLIAQRMESAKDVAAFGLVFSSDLKENAREKGDWICSFPKGGTGYVAVRCARGSFQPWVAAGAKEAIYEGWWLRPADQGSPVIVQLGRKETDGSFEEFMERLSGYEAEWKSETEFSYKGSADAGTLVWNSKGLPRIDGEVVSMKPELLVDGPRLSSRHDSGLFSVKSPGGRVFSIDFGRVDEGEYRDLPRAMPRRTWTE